VREWVTKEGLTLHPEKTRIVEAGRPGGFDFLGYHFERGMKWPRKKSMERFKDTIRAKTRRNQGRSMTMICQDLNRSLRGWFEYYKHSKATTFVAVDGYIRGRLRSILRRRTGRKRKGTRTRSSEMAKCSLHRNGTDKPETGPSSGMPISITESHYQLESRMREIRQSGSEGVGTSTRSSYLYIPGNLLTMDETVSGACNAVTWPIDA